MVSSGERLVLPTREELPGTLPSPALFARYTALVERCWAQQPEARPAFAEVCTELR